MRRKRSVLFVNPDYHCSFFYRNEFRKLGWNADIFVNTSYPDNLLFSDQDILRPFQISSKGIILVKWVNRCLFLLWWLKHFWRYQYHIYYGRPPVMSFGEQKIGLTRIFGKDFLLELCLSKLFGVKLVFLPTGCHDDESKSNFSKLDNGNVCSNCGLWDKCIDNLNQLNFSRIRRYFNMQIGTGSINSSQFKMTHMKYKAIDLNLWKPDLEIPVQHQLPGTNNLRIIYSSYLERSGRSWQRRNIKGIPFLIAAIERLKTEGHAIEGICINDKPSNQMRFYQAQSDIIVDQLIYGWWGSTSIEGMALGKPVICYMRPLWKEFFLKVFPEYNSLPIIEADTQSIYEVLKKLTVDHSLRRRKGEEARQFAEAHFDPEKNAKTFTKILEDL
jgi:glycosyltransferase involved in cell wall biosynthesis